MFKLQSVARHASTFEGGCGALGMHREDTWVVCLAAGQKRAPVVISSPQDLRAGLLPDSVPRRVKLERGRRLVRRAGVERKQPLVTCEVCYVLQRASVDDGLKPYVSAQRGSNKH